MQGSECTEKDRLLQHLHRAMRGLIALASQEMDTVLAGRLGEVDDIQARLVQARAVKDSAMREYLDHVRSHGCGSLPTLITSAD